MPYSRQVNEPSSGRKLSLQNSGKRCVKFDVPRSNDRLHAPFVLITVPQTILSIIRFDINERDLSFVSAVTRARRSYFSSLSCGAALRKSYGFCRTRSVAPLARRSKRRAINFWEFEPNLPTRDAGPAFLLLWFLECLLYRLSLLYSTMYPSVRFFLPTRNVQTRAQSGPTPTLHVRPLTLSLSLLLSRWFFFTGSRLSIPLFVLAFQLFFV